MSRMADLKNPRLIFLKGWLFLVIGILSGLTLLGTPLDPWIQTISSLSPLTERLVGLTELIWIGA